MKTMLCLFFASIITFCYAQEGKVTLPYKKLENVSEKKLSLDIYPVTAGKLQPVVIFVHGGAWFLGDKDNKIENKVKYFKDLNYVFVSVNYRLTNILSSKNNRLMFPAHPDDVADAVKYVYENIAKYGGDKNQIILMGHSAGAQMVSLLGTSQDFLPKRGIPLERLKGIVSLDTEGYDVYGMGQNDVKIYKMIFGENPDRWKQASPLYQIGTAHRYPPFFIVKRGEPYRFEMAEKFQKKLEKSGTQVVSVNADPYSHMEVNNMLGDPSDEKITPSLTQFLKKTLDR